MWADTMHGFLASLSNIKLHLDAHMLDTFTTIFISFLISYVSTPFMRDIARKFNIVDKPSSRKLHEESVAYLGGVALFLSIFISLFFIGKMHGQFFGVFCGALILFAVGVIDDVVGILPNSKLFGEILASLIIAKFAIKVSFLHNSILTVPVTILWVVGITNAFNLIDNMNGLSSGVAAISCGFFSIIAFMNGYSDIGIMFIAITGACFGFLKYNYPKASVFMGDAGSLFLGFTISSLVVIGSWNADSIAVSLSIPIIALSYPIFDVILVTLVRTIEGRKVSDGGKDHSSHRLVKLGLSPQAAVALCYCLTFIMGLLSLIIGTMSAENASIVIYCIIGFYLALGIGLGMVKIRFDENLSKTNRDMSADMQAEEIKGDGAHGRSGGLRQGQPMQRY